MRTTYIFLLFICFHQLSFSQACGGGKFTFEFYTKDNDDLHYEITQVEIKDEKLTSENTYMGVAIDSIKLKGINQSKIDKNKLPQFIYKSISCDDKIKNNELIFNTLELYNKLYLLTVWNKITKIQILVNLFGGCNRKNIVIMSDKPRVIAIN